MIDEFSTNPISDRLIEEIKMSLVGKEYGSVEIYIEAGKVIQITERIIKKTNRVGEHKTETKRPNYVYLRTSGKLQK